MKRIITLALILFAAPLFAQQPPPEIPFDSENEIHVAELLNWRVQKLLLKPGTAKSSTAGQ